MAATTTWWLPIRVLITELAGVTLVGTRTGRNVQHDQVALLRQSVYGRPAPGGRPFLGPLSFLSS